MALTWAGAISGGFAVVTVAVGATWLIRRDRIEELEGRLAAQEALHGADLPKLLSELAKYVHSANAEAELRETKAALAELGREVDRLREENLALRSAVTVEESFDLRKGQSHASLGGSTVIGVHSVSDSWATLTYDGFDARMNVGDFKKRAFGGNDYRIVLESIADGVVTFRVDRMSH